MKNVTVHSTSIVEDGAILGKNVTIGPFCVIMAGAEIGDNCAIGSYCEISRDVVIGERTILKSYVELRPDTIIGTDCYIDSRVSSSGKNKGILSHCGQDAFTIYSLTFMNFNKDDGTDAINCHHSLYFFYIKHHNYTITIKKIKCLLFITNDSLKRSPDHRFLKGSMQRSV